MRKKEYDSVIDGRVVPFSAHGDASDYNLNKGRRVKLVREFIGFDLSGLKTLDIGAPNAFGQSLGIKHNTMGDLNRNMETPSDSYDFILFSEIIEHLMNPALVTGWCFHLLKPGGHCLVSTPLATWHSGISMQSPHHFTEYRPDRLRRMFEYVGFRVVRYKVINIWDRRFAFYGVRPLLRVLFHRSQLWLLQKP